MPTYSTPYRKADGSRAFPAQVRVKGFKPVHKTLPSKKAAEGWALELEKTLKAQRVRGALRPDAGSLTFSSIAIEYLKDPDVATLKSFNDVHRQLSWWNDRYGHIRALEFGVVALREGRDKLAASHENATVNRYLRAASSCWNWARSAGLIPMDAVWPPRLLLREPKSRQRYLSDEELARVLAAADAFSPMMKAAVTVAIGTGIRQGELLRLDWRDVDFSSSALVLRVTKAGDPRRAHLPAQAAKALKTLHRDNVKPMPMMPVFVDGNGERLANYMLENRWQKVRKTAGVEDVRWHDLRHSTASFLIQNGATLAEVAHTLGHKSVATSARYAHLIAAQPVTGAAALDKKMSGEP